MNEWNGETYHGRPVTKASSFDWKVSTYIFILGIAGSAQIIAGVANRDSGLARQARWLALGGSILGPLILIRHLKTPSRWYNMMRIARPTSPMSMGSWLLAAFGGLSALSVVGDLFGRRWPFARRVADTAQGPAAMAGAGMSVYTASLLSSTSTPLWAAAPAPLAAQFGSAAMAGAASALALLQRRDGQDDVARRLERLAMLAGGVEAVSAQAAKAQWKRAGIEPAKKPAAMIEGGGTIAGFLLPFAAQAMGRAIGGRAATLMPEAASIAMLLGSATMRHGVLLAGNESAKRPQDVFRTTQR
ncbi:NrfD/PsrC family molybdoenzyme membrane anchor subunit [Falsiroseomonas sp.]|uniref:NrfD/PsrC family molybdoenzyme membrane anchor subunit n=1 Tax=Falsiroseomonas sp. TaxID=2870721 RepID=UPI00271B0251|nr:NrfD/PsrC family molybdoenzyme membrane anchor subunit [Falsiroseomonas sp.]MDO9502868.1 NrfD/PsrC family molybdoenzyme membrane anchor subunit [Falsiroseomonas sp.]